MRILIKIACLLTVLCSHPSAQTNVTPCLINSGLVDRDGCSIVGEPNLNGLDCTVSITRYLARSANMEFMDRFNLVTTCWPYNEIPVDAIVNCDPPYNYCASFYCPDVYCESIKMLVDAKIQFIARATSFWFREKNLKPRDNSWPHPLPYEQAEQLVIDINAAYDCKKLRRPIIQAGVFEGYSNTESVVKIPRYAIEALKDEMSSEELTYYSSEERNFIKSRIVFDPDDVQYGDRSFVNITKIEAKLWFYYQATTFIDFGYKSLHMGQYPVYARDDKGYFQLDRLLKLIRDYAESNNSFVIMNGEAKGGAASAKVGSTNRLLFDFDGRSMRPREKATPEFPGDRGCTDPIGESVFDEMPCSNELYPAVVDPCVIDYFGGSTGGISPRGCTYDQVPYFVYFDFGGGLLLDEKGCPDWEKIGKPTQQNKVYGYDDTRWFSELLSSDCQGAWWDYYYCDRRNYHGGHGFLQVPGILDLTMKENVACVDDPVLDSRGKFVLSDHDGLKNSIISTLETEKAKLGYSLIAWQGGCFAFFKVKNPDCSSTYSWHIRLSNGQWLPYNYGQQRAIWVSQPTTVYLRQDNLGLQPDYTYGVYQQSISISPQSCGEFFINEVDEEIMLDEDLISALVSNHDMDISHNFFSFLEENVGKNVLVSEMLDEYERSSSDIREIDAKIFPNPTRENLHIVINSELDLGNVKIDTYDLCGKKVLSNSVKVLAGETSFSIDSDNLNSGQFNVVITSDEYRKVLRFIKM